jgi:hypothetical protein
MMYGKIEVLFQRLYPTESMTKPVFRPSALLKGRKGPLHDGRSTLFVQKTGIQIAA